MKNYLKLNIGCFKKGTITVLRNTFWVVLLATIYLNNADGKNISSSEFVKNNSNLNNSNLVEKNQYEINSISINSKNFKDSDNHVPSNSVNSYLSLGGESFFSPDYTQTKESNFSYLGVSFYHLQDDNQNSNVELFKNKNPDYSGLNGEIHGQFFSQVPIRSYIDINQLFWESNEFSVGRQKYNWSIVDRDWELGVFEPRLTVNPVFPDRQGLTGVFAKITSMGSEKNRDSVLPFELVLFGSPIYIPDQGPNYEIKNGKFEDASPYFQNLPTKVRFFDQTQDIKYKLVKPDTNKIIFQQSYGASILISSDVNKKYIFQIRASTGYLPSPVLASGFQADLNSNLDLLVDFQPQSYYHRVSSLETKYSYQNLYLGVGGFKEQNMEPNYDPQWTYFKFNEASGVMPFIGISNQYINTKISFLNIYGGEAEAIGPRQSKVTDFKPNRYIWKKAWQAQVQTYPIFKKLKISSSFQQDLEFEHQLMNLQFDLKVHKYWQFFLGGQGIKVLSEKSPISNYDNHDIVFAGVSYAM